MLRNASTKNSPRDRRLPSTSWDSLDGDNVGGPVGLLFFLLWTGFNGTITVLFVSAIYQKGLSMIAILLLCPLSFAVIGITGLWQSLANWPGKVEGASITERSKARGANVLITMGLATFFIWGFAASILMVTVLRGWALLALLLPALFMLIGGGGVYGMLYGSRKPEPDVPSDDSTARANPETDGTTDTDSSILLKPYSSPIGSLVGYILFAVIWSGCVSVFIWLTIDDWKQGTAHWGPMLFLFLFIFIGIGALSCIPRAVRRCYLPALELRLERTPLTLGEHSALAWRTRKNVGRIRKFCITLEGVEEARYRCGSNTCTDCEIFVSIPIVMTEAVDEMIEGKVAITIPRDSMPTFEGKYNKIVWKIKVHGKIRRSQNIDEEYEVTIMPLPVAMGARPINAT